MALVNVIFLLGIVPSSWFRIVAPIRKRGPQVVADTANLRPICYVSNLEGLFDLCWLDLSKAKLINYAGPEQVGGRRDPVLVTIGILTAVQTRRNTNLPTFLLRADHLQGYDLAWRDAVRYHVWAAGIHGAGWLVLDSSLSAYRARVR